MVIRAVLVDGTGELELETPAVTPLSGLLPICNKNKDHTAMHITVKSNSNTTYIFCYRTIKYKHNYDRIRKLLEIKQQSVP